MKKIIVIFAGIMACIMVIFGVCTVANINRGIDLDIGEAVYAIDSDGDVHKYEKEKDGLFSNVNHYYTADENVYHEGES